MTINSISSTEPIDFGNRAILNDYAGEISKFLKPRVDPNKKAVKADLNSDSYSGQIKGYAAKVVDGAAFYLNPRNAGEWFGRKVHDAHGEDIGNKGVQVFCNWLLTEEIAAEQSGGASVGGWFKNEVVKPGIVQAAQMAITPQALPWIESGLVMVGGAGGVAAAMLVSYVYAKAMGIDPNDVTIKDVQVSLKDIKFEDGVPSINGKKLGKAAFEHLVYRINQHVLCQQMQKLTVGEVENFFVGRVFVRNDDARLMLPDGHVLSESEEKDLVDTVSFLKEGNPFGEKDAIRKTIDLFAKHVKVVNDQVEAKFIQSGDKLYEVSENSLVAKSVLHGRIQEYRNELKTEEEHKFAEEMEDFEEIPFEVVRFPYVEEVEIEEKAVFVKLDMPVIEDLD